MITDKQRNVKFTLMSEHMVPRLAVIDPLMAKTMPPQVTAETGLDALSHCIEGYVGMADAYHPYYEALALYGVKLIGRSLRKAFRDGENIDARTDLSLAASFGGICFTKGLGLGHAVSHVLGAFNHIPHGRGCALGLLCFVRANAEVCRDQFRELSWMLDRTEDLEGALAGLYRDLDIPLSLREAGIGEDELPRIAFETSLNVVNLAANPATVSESRILELLQGMYV